MGRWGGGVRMGLGLEGKRLEIEKEDVSQARCGKMNQAIYL